ncbi:MAG: AMP-binding protein [Terracidiphilus sp.]|nr:AMP-binding protein [Terracidiphilus sp.]MDR3797470.1 AMP-binding protein [Terracidiphilus sp.]
MRDHLATLIDDFRRFDREIAVVHYRGNRRHVATYGELARLAGRFAAFLAVQGIGHGDRVLLWAENSAEWIAAFYGCMLRGVLAVPLDAAGSADFAARVAADVHPKMAVGDALLLGKLAGAQTGAGIPTLPFEEWLDHLPAAEMGAVSGLSRETPLQVLFTSGTTGDPKGVVITHGNVLASVGPIEDGAQPYMRYERLIRPLRILHTLPLSHVFGQTMGLWVPPIFRAELHFDSRLAAPHIVELIRAERISVLAAVPRVLALLKAHLEANHPGLSERVARSQKLKPWRRWLRFSAVHREFGIKFWAFVSGGGALPGPLEQFWNVLGFVLIQGYGMTETTALITLNHPFHVAEGTIGKPMTGREVKLAPDGEVLVRGPMISAATWAAGQLRPRQEEWLATGDIAELRETGELRFLGRKSEVIVTAAGLNIHPEDIEAALEEQPEIAACAVVAMETPNGPEPCAVLACRGSGCNAAGAIERANAKLADFQRISRWMMWPEPDLPRTSTGKVRRKPVAAWLAKMQAAAAAPSSGTPGAADGNFGPSSDWLLALIAQITGEAHPGVGDELRLNEDLHLDSLGRVQLSAAIEERLGIVEGSGLLEEVHTLGELRRLVDGTGDKGTREQENGKAGTEETGTKGLGTEGLGTEGTGTREQGTAIPAAPRVRFVYPEWPWWKPFQWLRVAFLEVIQRPLTWLLAAPRVVGPATPLPPGPLLIVGNHVTAYDGPLIQYALAGPLRRHIAVAMAGDMLDDYRHWRNPDWPPGHKGFYLLGPPAYWLVTAFYNVFPLPRQRDFQMSFAHAGKAMDRGYSVMVFPEGARSEGQLARFRPGIGLLAKQSGVAVVPTAIRGLGEMRAGRRRWFRSGHLEVRVGEAIRFSPEESEAAITARLHDEVERLLGGAGGHDEQIV